MLSGDFEFMLISLPIYFVLQAGPFFKEHDLIMHKLSGMIKKSLVLTLWVFDFSYFRFKSLTLFGKRHVDFEGSGVWTI